MIPNTIERETTIAAPVDRVWSLLTRTEHIGAWWLTDRAEVDLRPGGAMTLHWPEHGEFHGVVEAVEPRRRFAFRWALVPDQAPEPGNSTQVEFTLAPAGDGTRVRVVERGFASLAGTDEDRARHVEDNVKGWNGVFAGLTEQVERAAA